MAFSTTLGGTPAIFAKFFGEADRLATLAAIPEGTRRVLFVDTPSAPELAPTIAALLARGLEVVVRDHHDEPSPRSPRDEAIKAAAQQVRELVGANALISNRTANPACSSLIAAGEFAGEGTFIVADPDADGLTAAMKAVGIVYDGLDADAAVLDGPRAMQTADRLTPTAYLLVRAMSSLPAFDAARPEVSEKAKANLFADFVLAVQGDETVRVRLETAAQAYEEGVAEARRLLGTVQEILPGVAFVDVITSPRFDLTTLAGGMEKAGVKVTVQRKSAGPIAGRHGGIQISLAVPNAHKAAVNLQELLPSGFTSSPEVGIISNTTFLLHVSQKVWDEVVLPSLTAWAGVVAACPACLAREALARPMGEPCSSCGDTQGSIWVKG